MEEMNSIELTKEQAFSLSMYLLTSTQYRLREQRACEELSKELDDSGKLRYPKMEVNAKYWADMNKDIEEIIKKIC